MNCKSHNPTTNLTPLKLGSFIMPPSCFKSHESLTPTWFTLCSLPLQLDIFTNLDPVSQLCLSLTSRRLYLLRNALPLHHPTQTIHLLLYSPFNHATQPIIKDWLSASLFPSLYSSLLAYSSQPAHPASSCLEYFRLRLNLDAIVRINFPFR